MSEKRGYPNPNYTDEDVMIEPTEVKEEITIDETVIISPEKFEQLCSKAAALDILTADIKRKIDYGHPYSLVDDDVVLAVTGMSTYRAMKEEEKKAAAEAEKVDGVDREPCTEGEAE